MQPVLSVSDRAEDHAGGLIGNGLNAFNDSVVGYGDSRPLHVLVRHPGTGEVLGGMTGRTSLGLWFIDLVFLPEEVRAGGIGTRMLTLGEEEARRRGCRAGIVYTISFQAPAFYERNGWRRFGEVACEPPGTSRIFLTKEIQIS